MSHRSRSSSESSIVVPPGEIVSASDAEPARSGTWPPLKAIRRQQINRHIQHHLQKKESGQHEQGFNAPQNAAQYLQQNGYTIGKELEKGYYGVVFKVTKGDTPYACKYVDKSNQEGFVIEDFLPEERKISQLADHENVVKTHSAHDDQRCLLLILDFANGGDLCTEIRVNGGICKESLMKLWWKQIVSGVKYLHESCGVTHRDLKCENILVFYQSVEEANRETAVLKVCDFTVSIQVAEAGEQSSDEDWSDNQFIGTPEYMAPEALAEELHDCRASDRWSLAVILFLMKKYVFPFGKYFDDRKQNYIEKQKANEWRNTLQTVDIDTTESLSDLYGQLFNPDWNARIKFDAIESHAWLTS